MLGPHQLHLPPVVHQIRRPEHDALRAAEERRVLAQLEAVAEGQRRVHRRPALLRPPLVHPAPPSDFRNVVEVPQLRA
eukprot:171186-Prorocentrum_minimum.AAC.1